MNSYARPDVRYCRDYLHSKCKQGLFGILEAQLLTSQVRRLTGGSARALPTGNLLTRDVNNKGQQNDKKPRFHFECKEARGYKPFGRAYEIFCFTKGIRCNYIIY